MFNILHESWKLVLLSVFQIQDETRKNSKWDCDMLYRCRLRFDKNASESDVIFVTWTQNVVEKGLALSEQLQWSTNVSLIWFISSYLHIKPVFGPMTSTTATGTPKCDTIVLTKRKKKDNTARAGCIWVHFLDVCYSDNAKKTKAGLLSFKADPQQ